MSHKFFYVLIMYTTARLYFNEEELVDQLSMTFRGDCHFSWPSSHHETLDTSSYQRELLSFHADFYRDDGLWVLEIFLQYVCCILGFSSRNKPKIHLWNYNLLNIDFYVKQFPL